MATTVPLHPLEFPSLPAPRLGSRALYPRLEFDVYLAHAAIAPPSSLVEAAALAVIRSMAQGGTASFPQWMQQRERLRSSFAEFWSVSSEDVTLSSGCTRGISDVALSLPWEPGQTLLTFEGEFPANVVPFQQAASLFGGNVRLLRAPDPTQQDARSRITNDVERAIREAPAHEPVRYVAVSAVQFQTGLAMPLAELSDLCRRHDVSLLVDGIQGCGVMPMNLAKLDVDAFFVGAHKWLLGLEGVGAFYTSERLRGRLRPRTAGWLSYQEGETFLFQGSGLLRYDRSLHTSGRMFEGSTSCAVGFAALEAGLAICKALGPQRIFEHVRAYHDALLPILEERGFRSLEAKDPLLRSCILSFRPPAGVRVAELSAALVKQKIMISTPDGLIRFAPHFSNSLDEIAVVRSGLDRALRELR